jgi:hypothetical protein
MPCNASYARVIFGKFFTSTIILYILLFAQNFYSCQKWVLQLPLGTKDAAYGKWSPNWHRPYRINQVLPGNAYMLEELDGVKFLVAVNGQHLKKYFPSTWDDRH